MSTASLHDYIARVESLLHDERYERAIALCQHALRTYPKCVEFYRLLGQACLETERPDDAADMFRRVLGADPQNFVAHVGLGVVAEGIGATDEAVWQWERALELEPNHSEVRDELRRVRPSNVTEPGLARVKLNRAALGYVYLRGEQYERAASEFRAVLDALAHKGGAQERFDLQVALAEALYRGGHQREAAEVCRQVLKLLPNALKTNLILGAIYHETERDEEARAMFERAQQLDPENRVAAQVLNPPTPLPKRAVLIEEPSGEAIVAPPVAEPSAFAKVQPPAIMPMLPAAQSEPAVEVPEWLKALGVAAPAETAAPTASVESESEPDWLKALREATAEASVIGAATTETQAEATAAPVEATDVGLPDWLRAAGQPPAPIGSEAVRAELPDWLKKPTEPVAASVAVAPAPLETQPPEQPALDAIAAPIVPTETTQPIVAAMEAVREPVLEPIVAETSAPSVVADLVAPTVTPSEPPRAAREGIVFFDDSAAPPSIETQAALTGEAEHQARLDLARAMRDIDLDSALDLYELMGDASPELRQQAVADLTTLASANPRAQAIVRQLGGEVPEAVAPHEPLVEPTVSEPPREAEAYLDDSIAPSALETQVAPVESQAPREAVAYLDDSSAPPSIETQAAPTGEAEDQARLELARMLVDLDVDSALDQYVAMAGAKPELLQQAIADVTALTRTHAEIERTTIVLEQLQGGTTRPAPVVDEMLIEEMPQPLAPSTPIISTEAMEEAPSAAPIVDETLVAEEPQPLARVEPTLAPSAPVVSEEAMEEPTALAETAAVAPAAPVVDEATVEQPVPALREGSAFLDESSAPPSVETHATPTGGAEYQARLDLARALKFIDVDAALDLYAQMAGAKDALRQQTIRDLLALAPRYPRAQAISEQLQGSQPSVAAPVESPQPEWLAEAQTVVSEAPLAPAEPVVSEEAMEQAVSAPEAAITPPEPIVSEETMEQAVSAPEAAITPPEPIVSEETIEPLAPPIVAEAVAAEPTAPVPARREGAAFLDDSAAPPSIETQAVPTGEDEHQARLELARAMREIDVSESAIQYKALIERSTALLPQVIVDLQTALQQQPSERGMRVLLADALARSGRLQEAVEQYRQLVS